mgnify:CR=1 FL=1|tara:strand:+ start:1721 stop:1987 length:267 start_codon:yes stop_codon:yes gene_type:complete
MSKLPWRDQANSVILNSGDIVIDIVNKQVGVLVSVERRITMEDDDLYFWYVNWTSNDLDVTVAPNPIWMEEISLKLSIIVGFYDLYSS